MNPEMVNEPLACFPGRPRRKKDVEFEQAKLRESEDKHSLNRTLHYAMWEFPKIGVPYFGSLQ